jgi:hypothetical protein
LISVAEFAWTGRSSTRRFHTLSSGKTVHGAGLAGGFGVGAGVGFGVGFGVGLGVGSGPGAAVGSGFVGLG